MPARTPPKRPAPRQWSLQDAKNKLSEVIGAAATAPQIVTRRGVKTAVVISYEDYVRVADAVEGERPSFEQFLLTIPKDAAGAQRAERISLKLRDVDL
jgi:prevent-host-death family protein